jgi:hypothetical protein
MTMPPDAPPPSAELPPLPPAIAAMMRQCDAIHMQLEALRSSLDAFANGLRASSARAQSEIARSARGAVGTMPPVFGAGPSAVAPADPSALLDRLTVPASPATSLDPEDSVHA